MEEEAQSEKRVSVSEIDLEKQEQVKEAEIEQEPRRNEEPANDIES